MNYNPSLDTEWNMIGKEIMKLKVNIYPELNVAIELCEFSPEGYGV